MKPKVGIISAGALGTALAQSISKNNDNILLWGRNPELINEINNEHTNSKYYPNFQLNENITGIDDLEKLYDCNVIILAIPSSVIREMMEKLAKIISPDCAIITTIKGIELSSHKTMSQIINEYVDNETYVLSGPNIAKEIMNNFPAATSIAGKGDYRLIESVFDKSNMKVDYNDDIIGTEFCGIIKNIIAISQGILEGMDINYNAKLAFFTKSFLEAKDIIEKLRRKKIIKLPEKFNEYDPETLKHLQDVYLMMLKDFIKVCDENQIEYYLDGGSALGAVRHQGFIPWDDDIDIILFRDEYNRLIEILEKLPQDKYELLSSKNKKCYCRLHSQWNLKGTKTEAYYDMNTDFTLGICLDIFVLDNIPNDGLRKKIFSIKQTLIRKLIWSYEITNSEAYISKNKERMGKILKIIFKIFRINFTKIKKINNNFIEKYRNENCENVCNLSTTYELVSIPKNIFHPPKKVKFEDVEVNIPNDYDKYLKIIYGDNYMQIPPKEDRYNHIYNTVDFGPYE